MKKTKLLAIVFALVLVFALTSCGNDKPPVDTNKDDYKVNKLTVGGVDISKFVLVAGDEMSDNDRSSLAALCETVTDVCGVKIGMANASDKEQTYEILIGNTGRELTSKELSEGTYAIEQTDKKLAIYANGDKADTFAIKYLADILLSIPEGDSYDIKLENISGKSYSLPTFTENNLPATFDDLRDDYDYDIVSANTVLDRFFATIDELPEEVTVLDRVELEDYPLSLHKKQVYVSSLSGDDNNPGTKNAPYKSIEKAVDAMKNQGGGVIWIEGGDYSPNRGIVIDDTHSGTAASPLFIKSYGENDVTITTNTIVESKGFKLVDTATDSVAARLHDDVEDKVYYVNLYDLGWKKSDIVNITIGKGPARVYVDGEEFTLAQYPNAYYEDGVTRRDIKDLLYFKYVYDTGSVTTVNSDLYYDWIERVNADPNLTRFSVVGWEIRIPHKRDPRNDRVAAAMGDEITSWVNTGDIWYYGSIFEGYAYHYFRIAPDCVHGDGLLGTKKDDGFYSLKSVQPDVEGCKDSANSAAGRNTYYLFNAIEALDAPGEWFIDKETGNFYIYPKSDDITKQSVTYSGTKNFDIFTLSGASNIVFDGIGANGTTASVIKLNKCDNVVIQNANIRDTKEEAIYFTDSTNVALIYSNLAYSQKAMVRISHLKSTYNLVPTNIFIQNNTFSDTPPTVSSAVFLSGCRVVASHNYFIDCCLSGEGVEHIIEYNEFEGGNLYITDGGMVYLGGYGARGIHVRNNLFHMFHKTHNAVYFDTMGSGMYAYYNVISTLGGQASNHKAWYSSSGHENVCYANIIILRNKAQVDAANGVESDEGTEKIKKGDDINESGLFYYYGDNDNRNSLAGHWWTGIKKQEISAGLVNYNQEAWNARYPEYMNYLEGMKLVVEAYDNISGYKIYYEPQKLSNKTYVFKTANDTVIWVPAYEYLDANGVKQTKAAHILEAKNGQIVVPYDDIVSIERLGRQAAFNVIKNNLILGGSTNTANIITSPADGNTKMFIKGLMLKDDNYFEFEYKKIIADADNYTYNISDEAWSVITDKMGTEFTAILKTIDCEKAGLTD